MKKTQALFRKLKNQRPNKEIIEIKCCGGLGNRLINLIGGLESAKIRNLAPIISWTVGPSCYAKVSDLFDTSLEIKEEVQNIPNSKTYKHKNQIPKDLDLTSTIEHLLKLKPKREIIDRVSGFIDQHNIDSNVTGLHIRKTDYVEDIDINFWIDTVMAYPSKRYFVCSDEEKVEDRFRPFPNTIVLQKKEYPTKKWKDEPWILKDFYWKGVKKDFNVSRSLTSVIEAFHDLLILSHTDIQDTSKYSTFLHLAKYYKTILDKVMN